jgi:hypothetical protein
MPALKFRVLLDSIKKEEIFRDIIIDDSDNFQSLYACILTSFGFDDNEMASFYVSDFEWNKGAEISLMDMSFGDDDEPVEIMSETLIRHHIESPKQRYILVHNFMDMWIFLIEMQEISSKSVTQPEVALSVGVLTDELRKTKKIENEDLQFDTEEMESELDFEDDYDEDDLEDFYSIDEFDM